MPDHRPHVRVVDEPLRDRAGLRAAAGIVGEPDLEMAASGPRRTAVYLVQGELNARLMGEPISAPERSSRAEGYGARLPMRTGREKRQQCNTLQTHRRSRKGLGSAASPGTAMTTDARVV